MAHNIAKQNKFTVGSVFIARFEESDGITPQGNDTFRNKIFIVLGHDSDGKTIGAVLVNSKINPSIRMVAELFQHQYPLKQKDHPNFLKHDSFVNCAFLLPVCLETLKDWRHLGHIDEYHFELILDTVKNSALIKPKLKKRFGLL